MTMTVGELKDLLDELPDDMEVRIAEQPRWAFEYSLEGAEVVNTNKEDDEEDSNYSERVSENSGEILYLIEGEQLDYLPNVVAKAIGWK